MRELQPGLWHWQARHPDWQPGESWPPEVSSYAVDDGSRLILIDPLAVPDELLALAGQRDPVIMLTTPWHDRDAETLVRRLGPPVFTPRPDTQEDLMRKYGVTAEQAEGGSPDLAWLRAGGGESHFYAAGDEPLSGLVTQGGREHNDAMLWLESRRALFTGDTVSDFGQGLQIPRSLLRDRSAREATAAALRSVLALPIELVLPAHGEPTDRAALERALG